VILGVGKAAQRSHYDTNHVEQNYEGEEFAVRVEP
jgi:hypothetical protein